MAARLDGRRIADAVQHGVETGAYPGAVILVSRAGETVYHEAFGSRSIEPETSPMRRETVFDLASLTKPLATTLAVMRLADERKLRLDDRVTRFIPNFGVYGKAGVTLRRLLAHCSGLAAWRPFFRDIVRESRRGRPNYVGTRGARDVVYEAIHRERAEAEPGTHAVYSDLGFLLLGELVELLTHRTLAQYCHERFYRPLGLRATGFIDLAQLRRQVIVPVEKAIAPTERCPWRRRILCGEVHDDNAWAIGGVAGHAGLFASAADVNGLLLCLRACARGVAGPLSEVAVRTMWQRDEQVPDSTWALGWDTPSPERSSAGTRISRHAVGHLGFSGTSVWMDLDRDCHIILLTNRVHPTRHNDRIQEMRPLVHDAVLEVLDA
jgi:CubicO group peptidase (beta-lactamase class C family)